MTFIKQGSLGTTVTELQTILRELDYNIPVTGIFDATIYKAVRNFQSRHLDKHNVPLEVDGKVGEVTWWALQHPRSKVQVSTIDYGIVPNPLFGGTAMGRNALRFAIDVLNAGARGKRWE